MKTVAAGLVVVMTTWAAASSASAQTSGSSQGARPAPVVEVTGGWSGFADEGVIHHALGGVSARYYISRRVSLGPELQYMVGPGDDRDLIVTGNLMVDLLAPSPARPRRTTPFVVAGGGFFRHDDRFGDVIYASTEGAFTAGVGVRTWVGDRVYVAADARVGWELHLRVAATVGIALR